MALPRSAAAVLLLSLATEYAAGQRLTLLWDEAGEPMASRAAHIAVEHFMADYPDLAAEGWEPILSFITSKETQSVAETVWKYAEGSGVRSLAAVCADVMDGTGTSAVVGPMLSRDARVVSPALGWMHMPHVSPSASSEEFVDRLRYPYFRRVTPGVLRQAEEIAQTVASLGYTSMGVLFDGADAYSTGLMHALADLYVDGGGVVTHVESVDGSKAESFAEAMSRVKEYHVNVIIFCGLASPMRDVLRAALEHRNRTGQAPPFGEGHLWIASEDAFEVINSPAYNFHTSDLRKELAGLFYIEPEKYESMKAQRLASALGLPEADVSTFTRAVYDAVAVQLEALRMFYADKGRIPYFSASQCPDTDAAGDYSDGDSLLGYLDAIEHDGAGMRVHIGTGASPVRHVVYNINATGDVNLVPDVVDALGDGTLTFPGLKDPPNDAHLLRGVELLALAIVSPPFVQWVNRSGEDNVTGTDGEGDFRVNENELRGLWLDILYGNELYAGMEATYGFTAAFNTREGRWGEAFDELVATNQRGSPQWQETARPSLLIGALEVTAAREQRADFAQPIIDTGSVLVVRAGSASEPSMWTFLDPFDTGLWSAVIGIIFSYSVLILLCEWGENDYFDVGDENGQAYRYLKAYENALWLSFTTMLACTDGAAVTTAGRLMGYGMFFYSLILMSTYTATLTIFTLGKAAVYQVTDVSDFYSQNRRRPARQLLVTNDTEEAAWICEQCLCCPRSAVQAPSSLSTHPRWITTHEEGIQLLTQSCNAADTECPLAMIVERTVAEYIINNNCALDIHPNGAGAGQGSTLHNYGIGWAFPAGSPFVSAFSSAMLQLKDSGVMEASRAKWTSGPCPRHSHVVTTDTSTSLESVAGLFLLAGVCMAVAVVVRLASNVLWPKLYPYLLRLHAKELKRVLGLARDSDVERSASEINEPEADFGDITAELYELRVALAALQKKACVAQVGGGDEDPGGPGQPAS